MELKEIAHNPNIIFWDDTHNYSVSLLPSDTWKRFYCYLEDLIHVFAVIDCEPCIHVFNWTRPQRVLLQVHLTQDDPYMTNFSMTEATEWESEKEKLSQIAQTIVNIRRHDSVAERQE